MTTTIVIGLLLGLCLLVRESSAAGRINTKRERVVRTLNQGIADSYRIFRTHSPMEGTGRELEAAGHKWRVSPFFIAAISATESSLGRAACRDRFNSFGLASCGYRSDVPRFRSWAHVYDYMGRYLSSRWPSARSTYDYYRYAKCSPCWGRKTAWWMNRLFGAGSSVRYG